MKNILFVFTGGTIGSSAKGEYICTDNNKPYVLISEYEKRYGNICLYDTISPYTLLSENLNGEYITKLVSAINENTDKYDGIIVTHGTDTLAYTAAALGYCFGNNSLPIVLVSSNFPIEDERSNGLENLHGAIKFICETSYRGVFVSYKNKNDFVRIHRSTRLCSHLPYSDEIFSIRNSYFGFFDNNFLFIKNSDFYENEDKISPFKTNLPKQCSSVLKISSYPGMEYPNVNEGVKYILFETYHSGTIDTLSDNARKFFAFMIERKIKVFAVGIDDNMPYESTAVFSELGILPLPRLSPVAAFMKLWLISSKNDFDSQNVSKSLGGDIV